jgi:hypothetical protein
VIVAGLGSIFGKVLSGGAGGAAGVARTAFGLRFDVKKWFFTEDRVKKFMDAKSRQALQEAGRRIRRVAQTSMRYVTSRREQERKVAAGLRKRAAADPSVSRPGEPPRAIKPHPWIRKNLFYAFEPVAQSVVIGPVGFPRGSGAPETLEFGGRTRVRNKQRRKRRIGSGGEIDLRGGRVIYTRLKTAGQVDRANLLNEQLYGPMFKIVHVAARPYMGPALRKVQPELPRLWAASVRVA